jgi:4-hydroxy-3-methylbut-2-enyl diphosphate reductase
MKVVTAKYSGFCPGVVHAEKKLFKARAERGERPICVLGYLIHNQTYIDYLSKNAIVTIKNAADAPEEGLLVLRTHGIQRQIEENLKTTYETLDLTCPKVKKIQLIINEFAVKGYYVLITGKADHPEVQGLLSYADKSRVIEKIEEIPELLKSLKKENIKKILIISQTTGERELFEKTCDNVREFAAGADIVVDVHDSICSITALREREALKIQKDVDVTFVIGDRLSSNAKKLYKVLAEKSPTTYFVNCLQDLRDLELPFGNWSTAQVVSSSSTPAFLEREIVEYLEGL